MTSEGIPMSGMDLYEAIYTTRAMRRLKPDPIPDDVLRAILNAAIRAPSGGNSQGWVFVVVRDAEGRRQLADIYRPLLAGVASPDGPYGRLLASTDAAVARQTRRMVNSARYLAEHLQHAPVIVVPCIRTGGRSAELSTGSSIYPAVQNLMLAARAHGIGSTLTTIHRQREAEVKAMLGIPADYETAALIPLGYPMGRWGVAERRPLAEVVFGDRWGEPLA